MAAGDNEKNFLCLLETKFGKGCLSGKQRYTLNLEGFEQVEISVDQSLVLDDGRTLLIEIDSGNMAKLIAGQYALLNGMNDDCRENTAFVVVHYYTDSKTGRDYTPQRTLKNINAIQHFSSGENWLKYNAIHIKEFRTLVASSNSIIELADKVWPNKALKRN
ncbi:hypothetical protein [Pseudoalteromonas sp. SR43-2]|uniref:hypothetical protein n=1 Tax=Pseudoalteromonas sp. SR43-2 TaxID=2760944 RepID=UPI0015F885A4|nr:hypothetical protein [Pseudoalteromonas sp. SR43-2]MBB1379464.1 hypothetical protein [Pseudoalteromonas sp. SR43-2]